MKIVVIYLSWEGHSIFKYARRAVSNRSESDDEIKEKNSSR
jgi:hypothetical protein